MLEQQIQDDPEAHQAAGDKRIAAPSGAANPERTAKR